jgi:hypothetical protein
MCTTEYISMYKNFPSSEMEGWLGLEEAEAMLRGKQKTILTWLRFFFLFT